MTNSPEAFARLVLVRHGESVGNEQQLWAGWTDSPLTELGHDQVRKTADRLAKDRMTGAALLSSPLSRAWLTAVPIGEAMGLYPQADEALKEMHFGELEALRGDRFPIDYPLVYSRWSDRTDEQFGWPGGESRSAFRARVAGTVARLAAEHPGQTVLAVTHSGFIRMALAHWLPEQFGQWWNVRLDNCSLTHLLIDGDGHARAPIVNDILHLDG